MVKSAFRRENIKRRALAIMLALTMTVQQGSVTFAGEADPASQAAVQAEAEAAAKAQAEAEAAAKAQAEAEAAAKAQAEAEAKAKAESEAKVREEAEAKAKAESEAKAKAESEAKAKAESEAKAKAESEAKAKAESEAKAKKESEAKAKEESEEAAKAESGAGQQESDVPSTEKVPAESEKLPSETAPRSEVQTEAQTQSESQTEPADAHSADTELSSETASETETASESETKESETEEVFKTEFEYSDGSVTVKATTTKEAGFPEDTRLCVDYLAPGSSAYEAALASVEEALGINDEEGRRLYGVIYDVYFIVKGKRVEPDDTVRITMSFAKPVAAEVPEEAKIVDTVVMHVNDDGSANNVKEYVNSAADGSISEVGFKSDDFSPIAVGVVAEEKDAAVSAQAGSTDLSGFVVSASISGAEETTTDGTVTWKVKDGVEYTVSLSFSEEGKDPGFDKETDTWMTYSLPDGFTAADIANQTLDIDVKGIGQTYTIYNNQWKIENGVLYFKWNRTDPNFNQLSAAGNAEFSIGVKGVFKSTATEVNFGGGGTKKLDIDTDTDVSVNKNAYYDNVNGKIWYTVSVHSTGISKNVKVEDILTGTAVKLDPSTAVEISGNSSEPSGGPVGNNKISYTFASMKDNETITIKYAAILDYEILKGKSNGKIEFNDTSNSVTVSSEGDPGEGDNNKSTSGVENQNYSSFNKDGSSNGNTGSWKITANPEKKISLGGTTLKDVIKNASETKTKYSGEGITILITKQDNTTETRTVTWSELGIDPEKDSSWTYSIPESDGPWQYEVTYTTSTDTSELLEIVKVLNGAEGKYGSSEKSIDVGPGEEDKLSINKSATEVTTDKVTWTMTVNVPAKGYNSLVVTDTIPQSNNEYYDTFDENSLTVDYGIANSPESYVLSKETNESGVVTAFSLTFYKSREQNASNTGCIESDANRTITITFDTQNNQEWLEKAKTDTWREEHVNTMKAVANGLEKETTATASPKEVTIDKTCGDKRTGSLYIGGQQLNNQIFYEYTVKVSGVSGDTIEIKDTFNKDIFAYYATIGSDNWNASSYDQGVIYGGDQYHQGYKRTILTAEQTNDGVTFTGTVPKQDNGTNYAYYKLVYYLVVKDVNALNALAVQEGGSVQLENTAEFGGKTDKALTPAYEYEPVTKEEISKDLNNRTVRYQVILNPSGLQLNNGDPLTATDSFENLSIDYETIDVACEGKGNKADVTYNFKGYTGTFVIPDETKVTITYTARIIGNSKVDFKNTVFFNGKTVEKSDSADMSSSGHGSASIHFIRLLKHEAGHMEKGLQGAEFELYFADGTPVRNKADEIVTFTTNDKGILTVVGDKTQDGWTLRKDTTYYLLETKAPEGYAKRDEHWEFTIKENPDYTKWEYYDGDILRVEDKKTEAQLTLKKSFAGNLSDDVLESLKEKLTFTVTGINSDGSNYRREISFSSFQQSGNDVYTCVLDDVEKDVTYTVVESNADADGYTRTTTAKASSNAAATYSEESGISAPAKALSEDASISFTNTYEKKVGSLEISKTVNGFEAESDKAFSFIVTLKDKDGKLLKDSVTVQIVKTSNKETVIEASKEILPSNGVIQFSLMGDQTYIIGNIPDGATYTVTEEADPDGQYSLTESAGLTGTIAAEKTQLASLTNTRKRVGDLKIKKTIAGNAASVKDSFTVKVVMYQPKENADAESVVDESVDGTYGAVSFSKGQAEITIKGGETVTMTGLPVGDTYEIWESDAGTYQSSNPDTNKLTGVIEAGATGDKAVSVSVTNTKNLYGGLLVSKTVAASGNIPDQSFEFTITLSDTGSYSGQVYEGDNSKGDFTVSGGTGTVNLKHGQTAVLLGIPNGVTYTVTEKDYSSEGYLTTYTNEKANIVGVKASANEVTRGDIPQENQSAWTNTINNVGSISLTKATIGNLADTQEEFHVTLTAKDGNGKPISDGTYGAVKFSNGTSESIAIKHGEVVLIEKLPEGTVVTVSEAEANQEYQTSYQYAITSEQSGSSSGTAGEDTSSVTPQNGTEVTIETGKRINFTITNRKEGYGGLIVKKETAGNEKDKKKWFAFKVTLSDKTITGNYGDVHFEKGVSTGRIENKDTEYESDTTKWPSGYFLVTTTAHDKGENPAVITGLPAGITYEVEEADYSKTYDNVTSVHATGTIQNVAVTPEAVTKALIESAGDGSNVAVFTNTRNRYSKLRIAKDVNGSPVHAGDEFEIHLTVKDEGGNGITGTYSGVSFSNGQATIKLTNDGSRLIEGLPKGGTYQVEEINHGALGYVSPVYQLRHETRSEGEEPNKITYYSWSAGTNNSCSGTLDGNESRVIVTNTATEISIQKCKKDGEVETALPGAHLQILDANGTVVHEWDSTEQAETVRGLKLGTSYMLHETAAPDGYAVAADQVFQVVETQKASVGAVEENTGDKPQVTSPVLTVEFVGTKNPDVTGNGTAIKVIDRRTKIFIGKADEDDPTNSDGTVKYLADAGISVLNPDGTTFAAWTSESGSPKELTGLKTGVSYKVLETGAPSGYVQITGYRTLTLNADGSVKETTLTKVTDQEYLLLLEDHVSQISIAKVDDKDRAKLLGGAHFVLTDTDNNKIREWDSSDRIPEVFTGELNVGVTYTLEETAAPGGYLLPDHTYQLILNEDGTINGNSTVFVSGTSGTDVVIPDKKTEWKLKKTKKDHPTEMIGGVHFQIFEKGVAEPVKEWDTTSSAELIEGLKLGTEYTLHESSAPEGYAMIEDVPFSLSLNDEKKLVVTGFSVDENGIYYVEDDTLKFNVNKTDASGDEIDGAVISVYSLKDDGTRGDKIDEWTSKAGETKDFGDKLKAGKKYVLVEDGAPAGYAYVNEIQLEVGNTGIISVTGTTGQYTFNQETGKLVLIDEDLKVNLNKVDPSSKRISEAKLSVYEADENNQPTGDAVVSWTSDGTVKDVAKELEAGKTYVLVEEEAPKGYSFVEDLVVKVAKDGKLEIVCADGKCTLNCSNNTIQIKDEEITFNVNKTDASGEEVEGAKLSIYEIAEDGSRSSAPVTEWVSDGTVHDFGDDLEAGKKYVLVEDGAPAGYAYVNEIEVTVDKDGSISVTGTDGEYRYDEETKTMQLIDDALVFDVNKLDASSGEEVEGALIRIYDKNHEPVDEWTSKKGEIHSFGSKLTAGEEYTLVEDGSPAGYKYVNTISFSVDKTGEISVNGTEGDFEYDETTHSLKVLDEALVMNVNKIDAKTGKNLSGAVIRIYNSEKKLVDEWTSTASGTFNFARKLELGRTYTMVEETAPVGYVKSTETATITVDEDGVIHVDGPLVRYDSAGNTWSILNTETVVKISKIDIGTGSELSGATIEIIDSKGNVVDSWTSADKPHEVEGLKTGETYTLRETVAPEGYAITTDTTFVLDEYGKVTGGTTTQKDGILLVEDAKAPQVSKVDATNEKELPGAHIQVIDSKGNIVDEWDSIDQPHTVKGVKVGETYILRETVAPDGYAVTTDTTFTIDKNGKVTGTTKANSAGVLLVEDQPLNGNGEIEVTKFTLKNNGAFRVSNQTYYTALFTDAALTKRFTNAKPLVLANAYTTSVKFTGLPYGTYYVAETDASGSPITGSANITSVEIENGTQTLSEANRSGSAVIKNTVSGGVQGVFADIRLNVKKEVLDPSGKALKVNDTFYFALYSDEACTQRVRGVGIQSIKLSGASGGTTAFRNLPYASSFYVAEVDKNGKKVASKNAFNYKVTVSGDHLNYRSADGATVTVTNQLKKGRVAADNRSNQNQPAVRTGDNTPVLPMLLMLIASGLAALYLALRRRRRV